MIDAARVIKENELERTKKLDALKRAKDVDNKMIEEYNRMMDEAEKKREQEIEKRNNRIQEMMNRMGDVIKKSDAAEKEMERRLLAD